MRSPAARIHASGNTQAVTAKTHEPPATCRDVNERHRGTVFASRWTSKTVPHPSRVGSLNRYTVTPAATINRTPRTQGKGTTSADSEMEIQITPMAVALARRGTFPSRYDRTKGPNRWCSMSQRYSRSEPLAKQAAASRSNGTVGNTGRNTPTTARTVAPIPTATKTGRTTRLRSFDGPGAEGDRWGEMPLIPEGPDTTG